MKYIIYILSVIFLMIIISCDNPYELNRPGDKLSGYITHVDSTLYFEGGYYYSVSVYIADSTNPFNRVPFRTDSLNLRRRDRIWETTYDMDGIPPGRYLIAATYSKYPKIPNEVPIVLGTYGCDTNANCVNHKVVEYPNYQGNFRNIFAWTDPAKRLN
jgi:hypothetical protein